MVPIPPFPYPSKQITQIPKYKRSTFWNRLDNVLLHLYEFCTDLICGFLSILPFKIPFTKNDVKFLKNCMDDFDNTLTLLQYEYFMTRVSSRVSGDNYSS